MKKVIIFLIVVTTIFLGFNGFVYFSADDSWIRQELGLSETKEKESEDEYKLPEMDLKPIPEPDRVALKTMFFGDVFWGRYVDDWSKASDLGYAYPFSGLSTFEREKYDAWIANLECPVTSTYRTSAQQESLLKFSCLPEYLPEAAKWFDAFSLSNNHTDNMEEVDGLKQTRDNLNENGIQYFGDPDNVEVDNLCEVVSFKASVEFDNSTEEEEYNSLIPKTQEEMVELEYSGELQKEFYAPIALCGYHNVFKLPLENELQEIARYSEYFPVVVMPHQGAEYGFVADQLQTTYYREMIDLGADVVLGGHTHTVQNTEVYKNKLIVFSLGNFIFDQQSSAKVTRGLGVGLEFVYENDYNFLRWQELAKSCTQSGDSCLSEAESMNLHKPEFEIEYEAVGTDSSGKLTKKASAEVQEIIFGQANWAETLSKLSK